MWSSDLILLIFVMIEWQDTVIEYEFIHMILVALCRYYPDRSHVAIASIFCFVI